MPDRDAVPDRDEAVAELTRPGAPFEIRLEDVRGEQLPVFRHRHRSVTELLVASGAFGDADYLVTDARRLGFSEHLAQVSALAAGLRDEYGVHPGDRVAICAANCVEWIQVFWAATALGAVTVGMNSLWAGPEIAYALEHSEPTVVVVDEPRERLLGDARLAVLSIERDLPGLIDRHAGAALPEVPVHEDDPVVILYTSGTSGRPKGATHSHRNVVAACWFHLFNDALATAMGQPPSPRRFLLATPLFHIAALHNLAVIRLVLGEAVVIHAGRFDVDRVLRLIERERVTNWTMVPTMASRLVEHGDLSAYDLSSLRAIAVATAPSSAALQERLRELLPVAGLALASSYGLTESSTAATQISAADLRADPSSVGRPVPTMQIEIRDPDGQVVADGTEGEICLRGAQMMLGYWRDPEATRASSAPHGWFRTGDLGTMREGQLRISSRRSDLILRGGENVYPAEVENALAGHPAVRECLVVGIPHEEWGEEVGALVVTHPGTEADPEALRAHVAERLARYKVPTRWALTTSMLPRNATGKVSRAQVDVVWPDGG